MKTTLTRIAAVAGAGVFTSSRGCKTLGRAVPASSSNRPSETALVSNNGALRSKV
jgi:hypothetical protein